MTSTTKQDTETASAREAMAAEAAEILSIARAISRKETADRVFSRLETFDTFATKTNIDPDEVFVALSLPTANDLIHLTTTRARLANARQWVRTKWSGRPPADESTTLASLMLIYIVHEGWKRHSDDSGKREIWNRIKKRVDAMN